MVLQTASGCGIYEWDPIGICCMPNRVTNMTMKESEAVKNVMAHHLSKKTPKNTFFDFTVIAM